MQQEIIVARTVQEVESWRDVWCSLQQHFNADLDFYLLILQQRPQILRPNVIVMKEGGTVRAMALGWLEDINIDFKLGYKALFSSRVRALTLIYGGLLGEQSPDTATAFVGEYLKALGNGEADVAQFSFLRLDSPMYRLLRLSGSSVCRDCIVQPQAHWRMQLPKTLDEALARLSRNHRQQLKRNCRNFEKAYPDGFVVRCYSSREELARIATDVEEIAKRTYQRGLGVGFLNDEETRKRLELESSRGRLAMYVLYAANKPAAFWWGTLFAGTFYSHALGYDPRLSEHSPGMFLIVKAVEDLCQRGIGQIDFGIGDARYKSQFGNEHWEEASLRIFAARSRPILLNLSSTLNAAMIASAKKVLSRTDLISKLKGRWRKRLTEQASSD